MQLIVVAVDDSPGAERALALACDLATRLDASLHLVHVLDRLGPENEQLEARASVAEAVVYEARAAAAGACVERARVQAAARGVRRISTETRAGPAAQTLLAIAREERADAIVVGKRGHGRVAGLLLGSVSQEIVCTAHCPVVVAP